MRSLLLAAALLAPLSAHAEAPDMLLLPKSLVLRAFDLLRMDGGSTAMLAAQAIADCAENQEPNHPVAAHDRCPAVTEAMKAKTTATATDK